MKSRNRIRFFPQINKDKLEKKFLTFLSIKEAYEEESAAWKKITRVGREKNINLEGNVK